jgi:hypothetical protein
MALPEQQRLTGEQLLGEISTTKWLVEWNLPCWLGEAFGLTAEVTGELVLGNVYGLAYVRLQDNLFDGEADSKWEEATALAAALYQHWITQYRQLFTRSSPFWEALDRYTGQWLRASLEKGGPGGAELRSGMDEPVLRLAERGAPLNICCVAASLLAGQETVEARLLSCISHLLAGAVLVDHAADWQDDLASGRYNALAAFLAANPEEAQASPQTILKEFYLGSAAKSYFDLAQQQFRQASRWIDGMGITGLTAYLKWAEEETRATHKRLAKVAKEQLHMATAELLQTV